VPGLSSSGRTEKPLVLRAANSHLAPILLAAAFLTGCRLSPKAFPPTIPVEPIPSPAKAANTLSGIHVRPPTTHPSAPPTSAWQSPSRLVREATVEGARHLAWSPDGRKIALTTSSGVTLLDGASLGQLASRRTDSPQYALAFSDDGKELATADGLEVGHGLRVWNGIDLALVSEYDLPGSAMTIGFLPESAVVVATSGFPSMGIWIASRDGGLRRALAIEGAEPLTAALYPRLGLTAVSVGPGQAVQVWDSATATLREELPFSGAEDLQFTHDGSRLLAVLDFVVEVWDLQEQRSTSEVPVHGGTVSPIRIPARLAVSQDDHVFATGTEFPSPGIGLWLVNSGRLAALLPHDHLDKIIDLSFNPANSELAILFNDGRLEVWDIASSTTG
jgi:WD40 repeat protein